MVQFKNFCFHFSRILIAIAFLTLGLYQIIYYQKFETILVQRICYLANHTGSQYQTYFIGLLPLASILWIIYLLLEIIGAILLFFQKHINKGCIILIALLLYDLIIYLPYLFALDPQIAIKDVAIIGGLFCLKSGQKA